MGIASQVTFFHKYLQRFVVIAMLMAAGTLWAEEKPAKIDATGTPHEVVGAVTDYLLDYLKSSIARLESDPKGYYAEVRGMLEPVIAFRYIAKNVMGDQFWASATKEQQDKFVNVFTDSLVETYVKAMASYSEFEVSVVPPTKDEKVPAAGKVSVSQIVKSAKGDTKVAYTLARRNAKDNWQLINVALGSSNLGLSLRGQFAGAVSANLPPLKDGEKYSTEQLQQAINLAIDNWGKA